MSRSCCSSTWMLPLLLLSLCLSFHQSSSSNSSHTAVTRNNCKMHEFNIYMEKIGKAVKNCSENCSSVQMTDKVCQCLNISVPEGERVFFHYFTEGLNSVQSQYTSKLVRMLKRMLNRFDEVISSLKVMKYEPVISPKRFWEKLNVVIQQINTICAETLASNK